MEEMEGMMKVRARMMWGQRRPHTPAAGLVLHVRILTDAFTGAHGKRVARDVWGAAPRPCERGPRRGSNLSVTYLIGGPLPVSSIRQEALPEIPEHEERTERCVVSPSFEKVLLDFWSGFRYPYRETVTPFGEDSYYGKYGRFAA